MNHLTLGCSLFGVAMPTLKQEAAGDGMGLLVSPTPLWELWGAPIPPRACSLLGKVQQHTLLWSPSSQMGT